MNEVLTPNQAFERTRRFSLSTWLASVRRAAQLDRYAAPTASSHSSSHARLQARDDMR